MMNKALSRPILRGGVLALAAVSMVAVASHSAEARGRDDNAGAAIAAGVVGLAVGAMIGSAASANTPTYYAAPPATPYYPAYNPAPVYSAPVYTAPTYTAPTYTAPTYTTYSAPTYVVQPQPVYVQPAPVYVQPVPVYRPPSTSISIGFGSGPRWSPPPRYYGGRDRWDDRRGHGGRGGPGWDRKW